MILTGAATHLPLASVALPACSCGCPCQCQLRVVLGAQDGLSRSLLLLWEASLRQVLLPVPSPSERCLDLQEPGLVDSLQGVLVQSIQLAGWAEAIR